MFYLLTIFVCPAEYLQEEEKVMLKGGKYGKYGKHASTTFEV